MIAADKHYLVVSRLEPVLMRNGLPSYEALVQGLKRPDSLRLQEQVIDAITTKETSFNRDGHPFEELRRSILPELARRLLENRASTRLFNPKSRIWCAAVATGQEPYSVAMAVADFLASRPGLGLTGDDFPILATDISEAALTIAREGRYTTSELGRGISPEQRTRYFRQVRDGWVVDDSLRRGIEFRRLNLIQPLPNLGTFDLILCRNLLIYLDEEFTPPPVSEPSSGAQPRWDSHDRRGGEHLRRDRRFHDGATRQYVHPPAIVMTSHPVLSAGTSGRTPPPPIPRRSEPAAELRSADPPRSSGRRGPRRGGSQDRHDQDRGLPAGQPERRPQESKSGQGRQAEEHDVRLAGLVGRPGQHPEAMSRPGSGRRGLPAAAAIDAIARGRALEPLEECLVAAVVVQAEQAPPRRDREPGEGPGRVARPGGQAVTEGEAERQVHEMVHEVVVIDAVQARGPVPAGDLAVDVVEPEAEVRPARRRAGNPIESRCRWPRLRPDSPGARPASPGGPRAPAGPPARSRRWPSAAPSAGPASCRSRDAALSARSAASSSRVGSRRFIA